MGTRTRELLATAAAALVSGALLAQPRIESIDPEQELLAQIAALQAEAGAAKPATLVEPLSALARLHQEAGDHGLAIAALEEARHVTRVHQGLSSADEALLLRQQIRSEKALGQHERVWNQQQDMVTMARQHHDDSRMLPIFGELAAEWSDIVEDVYTGARPPLIYLGCYYGAPLPPYDDTRVKRRPGVAMAGTSAGGPNCNSGSRDMLLLKLRSELLMYYADAIETILRTGDYASAELREFERAAFRVGRRRALAMPYGDDGSFTRCSGGTLEHYLALEILDSCLAPVGRGARFVVANVGGFVGLVRLISYEIRSGAPAAERARAMAELADWTLLSIPIERRRFEESAIGTALAFYDRAYRELERSSHAQSLAAELFAPEIPVTLPTFEPNPFVAAATPQSSRYIDVTFAITTHGKSERVEVLPTSKDATRREERDLIYLIESTSFRPRLVDGQFADSALVSLRYHLRP